MVRQVFAGEFRQSRADIGFDFGICLFYLFDEGVRRGERLDGGIPSEKAGGPFSLLWVK